MIYAVEYGVAEKTILRQAGLPGAPAVPQYIQDAPELEVGLDFLFTAFNKLSSCRPPTFAGVSRIPWTAVSMYCRDYEIVDEDREDFEYVIEQVDLKYIKYLSDKAEKDRARNAKAPPPRKVAPRRR